MPTITEPVGYTFQAETLCPNCTIEALKAQGLALPYDDSSEDSIRSVAWLNGVEYDDPHTYDTDDFPKPILALQIECGYPDGDADNYDPEHHERCGACHATLCGED